MSDNVDGLDFDKYRYRRHSGVKNKDVLLNWKGDSEHSDISPSIT